MDTERQAGWDKRGVRLNAFRSITLIIFLLAAMPASMVSAADQASRGLDRAAEQEGGRLVLGTPETTDFPTIRFRLDAYSPSGDFIGDLKAENIQVIEDQQQIQAQSIEKIDNGLQIVVALNLAPSLGNKQEGQTEYDRIQASLNSWARAQSEKTIDDFSLATPTGLFLIRSTNPAQWVKALQDYKPDLVRSQPTLSSLAEALDLAMDPLSNPFTKRSIIYITPPLTTQNYAAVPDLTSRAKQTGVRVHVWMMAPLPTGDASAVDAPLQELAKETGGSFTRIAPGAPLPSIDAALQPMRGTYQVQFTSAIQKSGVHNLHVSVERQGLNLQSNERSFELAVQPPNPIFLSPPATIERSWSAATNNAAEALFPDVVQLQIMVEFPDQHGRSLKATRLYVNDNLVDENTEAPFDRFSWPVSSLTATGRQLLRVEAVDSLGLTGASLETPVEVMVEQRVAVSALDHISSRGVIAVAAVVLSGGALALVLVLSNRQRQGRRKRGPADQKRMKDPVTQPVSIYQEVPTQRRASTAIPAQPIQPKTGPLSTTAWPAAWLKAGNGSAPARLVTLDENEQPITGGVLALVRQEITFGSDPLRATQLLESATVDGLHARLYRSDEGDFYLADQGSVAGTWINYAPAPEDGMRLEHGDLIHIGRVMLRFELLDHTRTAPAEIKVTDLDKRP